MNERIKELYKQAEKSVAFLSNSKESKEKIMLEKFAELIVIECASICYNSGLEDSDAHAQNLMFHFNIDNCRNDK